MGGGTGSGPGPTISAGWGHDDTCLYRSPAQRKLYAVVRADLPEGLQAAQMAHAVAGLVENAPQSTKRWQQTDNVLIVLEAEDEKHLRSLAASLLNINMTHYVWHEPDQDMAMTALAAFPEPRWNTTFEGLPLAYKRKRSFWDWIAGKV